MSYTDWEYRGSGIAVTGSLEKQDIEVTVSGTVTNCGLRDGAAVVQLYLGYPENCPEERPVKVLRNFAKIGVKAGESRNFEFKLHWRDLAFFDETAGGFTAVGGNYCVLLGRHAGDIFAKFNCPVV